MNDIPDPPQPPEPTNVYGNSFIPKRPVPPYVEPPRIEYIGGDELEDHHASIDWLLWIYGIFLGIAIGVQLAKVI